MVRMKISPNPVEGKSQAVCNTAALGATLDRLAKDSTSETFEFEPAGNTHTPCFDDFCRALLDGGEPLVTGEEGARSQELVAAITLSGCRSVATSTTRCWRSCGRRRSCRAPESSSWSIGG